jgi:hypothetical protein
MKKLFLVVFAVMLCLPVALAVERGVGTGITMQTEKFPPLVWMCDKRIVLDDFVEPGRISPGGTPLIERVENYAFEGEQIHWLVLVMDKNGIDKVKDVYVTVGPEQGNGEWIEANCQRIGGGVQQILPECNAKIQEETLTIFDPLLMSYYDCLFTVESGNVMYGQYWVTVEAVDLDDLSGSMDENEFWFFNPDIALVIDGAINFGIVRPGATSYSDTITVGNGANPFSGVLLDMFISGTDFYDPAHSGAKCPTTNQLALTNFAYFATNGAYSTQGLACSDLEGYKGIPYGNMISQAKEIIGCDLYNVGPFKPGNSLSPGAEMALTFKLNLPEPCNGDFSDGNIFFWGEAV